MSPNDNAERCCVNLAHHIAPGSIDINAIAEDLRGTCQSMAHVLEKRGLDEDDLTIEQFRRIDDQVFECAQCNWWCEISEAHEHNGESFCDDCAPDDDSDDD